MPEMSSTSKITESKSNQTKIHHIQRFTHISIILITCKTTRKFIDKFQNKTCKKFGDSDKKLFLSSFFFLLLPLSSFSI